MIPCLHTFAYEGVTGVLYVKSILHHTLNSGFVRRDPQGASSERLTADEQYGAMPARFATQGMNSVPPT
jgi:hypothetical protein